MSATTTAWVAFAAYLAWAGWVFAVKTLRAYRATGDLGIRRSASTPVLRIALPLMGGGFSAIGVGALVVTSPVGSPSDTRFNVRRARSRTAPAPSLRTVEPRPSALLSAGPTTASDRHTTLPAACTAQQPRCPTA